jgi:hypothetical protein
MPKRREKDLTPAARRILFPFVGSSLSESALAAALRLCQAEGATLVAAFLAKVPMNLPLDAALPKQATLALPVLEAVEQRALQNEVEVDSRIVRGRTYRHALSELVGSVDYDRLVAAASARNGDGFRAADVAWMLENLPGEIAILRPPRPEEDEEGRERPGATTVVAASG